MALSFRYKAVLSDIDGTLLGPDGRLADETVREVRRVCEDQVPFALVTGRMPSGVAPIYHELGLVVPAVCYSGALVLDADRTVIESRTLSAHDARGILKVFERFPSLLPSYFHGFDWFVENLVLDADRTVIESRTLSAHDARGILKVFERFPSLLPSYFHGFDWFVENVDHPAVAHETSVVKAVPTRASFKELIQDGRLPNKIYCNCVGLEHLCMPLSEEIKRDFPDLTVIRSERATMVEVLPAGVSKATGSACLLSYLGVDPKDVVAFGDDANDIPMLELVGHGVAMANATQRVQQAACATAPPARENGVARYLQGCWTQRNDRKADFDVESKQ